MKPSILFILHLEPPVHGASVVGSYIKNSKVINDCFDSHYINLSTADSLSDIGQTSFKKLFVILKLYLHVFSYVFSNRVDLCYLTINASGPAWLKELGIVAILKLLNIPLVFHYHNKGVKLNASSWWKKQLYKFQFEDSTTILLSNLLYDDVADFVSVNDVQICANGIPNLSNTHVEIHTKTSSEICKILFLSNLFETKGVYVLLEACALLKNKNIQFNCVFVGGEGDVTEELFYNKTKQLNLQNHVVYIGKKYADDKVKIFAEADLFAFPTFYKNETFGLVNLEAMQFSLPVISTFEGGIPDVVVDGITGYLIPQNNIEALADKLELLIVNPTLRQEMGKAGKKRFEEYFTLEIFEKRLTKILLNSF